ncbi:MAG: hypothetical protein DCC75_04075 [Proteobacteria bacterium]|nr:MAG: hypothetical protein DCC75_04075 [Pseudomonadota bacterium]
MTNIRSLDKNMPILIVDDVSTMRRVIKNCLKSLGFENITEAEDGPPALEMLRTHEFKMVVSDCSMPQMSGTEMLEQIRKDPRTKNIPFIMITSESQKECVLKAVEKGLSAFIVKPFTANVLQSKMEAVFSK